MEVEGGVLRLQKELHPVLFVDVQNELNKKKETDGGEGQQHKRIFETRQEKVVTKEDEREGICILFSSVR